MLWEDKLKTAGVSIHIIATGAGAGLQKLLWEVPGSSAYLSGASFPYAPEETEELLGFKPAHFCDEAAAIDLASAAYMKAYRFGGKKPVGFGLTASVASEKEHRGDHRVFMCAITDDRVLTKHIILKKGVGAEARLHDGHLCDEEALMMLLDATGCAVWPCAYGAYEDATQKARARFMELPFFSMEGKRYEDIAFVGAAIMPGSFNPPHQGHFGTADSYWDQTGGRVVFEVTANPPHKAAVSVQDLLKRAKLLQGHDRLFTQNIPKFIEKARRYPGVPLILGADTMLRILDPKWGIEPEALLKELHELKTELFVAGRMVDGKFVTRDDIVLGLSPDLRAAYGWGITTLEGRWDISSTEIRNGK
jgi:hypothetical protein